MTKTQGTWLLVIVLGIFLCEAYVGYRVHEHYQKYEDISVITRAARQRRYDQVIISPIPLSKPLRYADDHDPAPPAPPPPPGIDDTAPPTELPDGLERGWYHLEDMNGRESWQWNGEEWVKNEA